MSSDCYFESLKFDKDRVMKKNNGRVNNLKNFKVVGTLKEKNKYNYIYLDDRLCLGKDIIIVIDSNLLRMDILFEVEELDMYLDNYEEYISFFEKNKFKKNYSKLKDKILLNIYKKVIKIYRYAKRNNVKVKDIYLINYDKNIDNNYMISELDNLISIYLLNEEDRVNYIYDYMCDYLDNEFIRFNLCDFKDNKCVSRRDLECNGCKNPVTYGCCYTKGRVCPNLVNYRCTIKSLPCKFFTCRYLEKRGIKYRPWDYLMVRLFLNYRQMKILDQSLYTPKDIIMSRMLRKKKMGYLFNYVKKIKYNVNLF